MKTTEVGVGASVAGIDNEKSEKSYCGIEHESKLDRSKIDAIDNKLLCN